MNEWVPNQGPIAKLGPFEEIGSLKGVYFTEKVSKIKKIAPKAINVLKYTFSLSLGCSFGNTKAVQKWKSKYH